MLGPGTGMGVAGLVPAAEGWVPIPGEGGHVTVPVLDERDHEIVRALRADGLEHVVAEHLLSGPGLARIHRGLARVHGVDAPSLSPRTSWRGWTTPCAPRPSRSSAACSAPSPGTSR
nr:hypothetical protein GCM10020093_005060 [Planobispora longispora]